MLNPLTTFTRIMITLLNLVVAILFLLGCYSSYFDPKHWWEFGFLTLAIPYLLVFLIAFIFIWLFFKPEFTLISILAIALAWYPIQDIIPLRPPYTFALIKKPGTLRIMSWNVENFDIVDHKKHPEIKDKMINLINEYQPDIACFQEMIAGEDKKAIYNAADFAKKLGFNDYHYSYNIKLDYDPHHHYGIIIYSKLPVINRETISYPPGNYNSIFQYIDVVYNDDDTLRIFNVHLQTLKLNDNRRYLDNPSLKSDSDIIQSKSVLSKLKAGFITHSIQAKHIREELNKSPYPILLCGDFNDVPKSFAYETIGRNLQNAFVKKGSGIGRTFFSISPTLRIDNIFVDKKFKVEQFTRVRQVLSDHFPIITDIKIR